MRAGALRHRAMLQEERRINDGLGGHVTRWVDIRPLWAEITLPTGRISNVAEQLTAAVTAEIRVRPSSDFLAGRRIVSAGTAYLIEAALPNNNGSMTRLLCSSVVSP